MSGFSEEAGNIAYLFMFLWMWSYQAGLRSGVWFVLRTVMVAAYCVFACSFEAHPESLMEWFAMWAVTLHWIEVGTCLLFPDPRFRRRTVRG